jgi:hypothetical protein
VVGGFLRGSRVVVVYCGLFSRSSACVDWLRVRLFRACNAGTCVCVGGGGGLVCVRLFVHVFIVRAAAASGEQHQHGKC